MYTGYQRKKYCLLWFTFQRNFWSHWIISTPMNLICLNTELKKSRVATSFSNAWKWKAKVKSLSRLQLLATPWTAAHQAPPSMGFSRQEYWSWGAIAFSDNPEHWFSKCGPQIIRRSITWKHKFQSWALPQTFWIRNSRSRTLTILTKFPDDSYTP